MRGVRSTRLLVVTRSLTTRRVARAAIVAYGLSAVGLSAVGLTGACARAPGPIDLSGSWPAHPGNYRDQTADWTRRGILREQFQQTLEVLATFRAPPWRAARAAHEARIRGTEPPRPTNVETNTDYEFLLVVTTYDRAENDLDRGDRSVWRVAMVDDAGAETAPTSIVRDKRPAEAIRVEVPELGDFATVYRVSFPGSARALGPDVRAISLRVWSDRGAIKLTWRDAI
jgi:hypothetical protein